MYRVTTDQRSQPQVDALPAPGAAAFAEVRVVLEVAPWNGDPLNRATPDAPVRTVVFGSGNEGLVTYLVLEDRRRVDVLDVLWLT